MATVTLCRAALILFAQAARIQERKDRKRGRLAASRFWSGEAEELESAAVALPRCHGNRSSCECPPVRTTVCRREKCLGHCVRVALAIAGAAEVLFKLDLTA